ncbi:radical SAM protein [Lachnospiraceae bacterium 47-T17]
MGNSYFYGEIALSYMCNLRHKFCFQTSFAPNKLDDEILYHKLIPLYQKLKSVRILGGEPTIIPGIKEYLAFLKENWPEMDIEIVTNGIALDAAWLDFVEKYGINVQISVNGITKEVFSRIMLKGDSERLRESLYANLERAITRHHESNKPILNCISMVVNKDTEDDLEGIVQFCIANGINLSLQLSYSMYDRTKGDEQAAKRICKLVYFCEGIIDAISYNVPKEIQKDIESNVLNGKLEKEKKHFLDTISKIRNSKNKIRTFLYCHEHIYDGKCKMPTRGITIMPDGFTYSCCGLTRYPLGNVYFDSIESLMYSDERNLLQKKLNEGCYTYCFDRCPYNLNPLSSINNQIKVYKLPYKELFEKGEYSKAAKQYEVISKTSLYGAIERYEHAYCLHVTDTDIPKAIELYSDAYKRGFSKFWICYNRADAYIRINELEKAKEDIREAYQLDSSHDGIRMLYEKYILAEKK